MGQTWINANVEKEIQEAVRELKITGADMKKIGKEGQGLLVLRVDGNMYNKILTDMSSFLLPIDGEEEYVWSF